MVSRSMVFISLTDLSSIGGLTIEYTAIGLAVYLVPQLFSKKTES
jgi:hypothetical protein